jgi:putative ABC transport system permease protein
MPLYADYALWKNPKTKNSRAMFVYGFNPRDPAFLMPELTTVEAISALQQPDTTLYRSPLSPEFGPQTLGLETEVDRRHITIVGQYDLGGGFAADGTLIMSESKLPPLPGPPHPRPGEPGPGVVQPGANLEQVQAAISDRLPEDVAVYTKAEIIRKEAQYWIQTTSIGFIFGLG